MAGLPKADDLAAELGVEDLYEFLGVRSDSTDKEVGYKKLSMLQSLACETTASTCCMETARVWPTSACSCTI